ncbi:MAG: hypothetical protein JSS81_19250 [Acidobacteria bacterium]|nr:hypothetical protein [Acidobacteriota bacterium]
MFLIRQNTGNTKFLRVFLVFFVFFVDKKTTDRRPVFSFTGKIRGGFPAARRIDRHPPKNFFHKPRNRPQKDFRACVLVYRSTFYDAREKRIQTGPARKPEPRSGIERDGVSGFANSIPSIEKQRSADSRSFYDERQTARVIPHLMRFIPH